MSGAQAFQDALEQAVTASGMSVNRIAAEVKAAGATISRTALSAWLAGTAAPRRHSSMTAVLALERVLGTEPGFLAGHLDLPAGEALTAAARTTHAEVPREIDDIRSEWGIPQDDGLERLLVQIRLEYSEFTAALTNRWVLRAERNGAQRFIFAVPVLTGTQTPAPGELQVLHGGSLGRRAIGPGGAIIHEVVLDRPLRAGETGLIELLNAGAGPQRHTPDHLQFMTMRPLGAVSLQVRFLGSAVPAEVLATTEDTDAAGHQARCEKTLAPVDGVVHLTMAPVNVGGIRLEWDAS